MFAFLILCHKNVQTIVCVSTKCMWKYYLPTFILSPNERISCKECMVTSKYLMTPLIVVHEMHLTEQIIF